MNILFGTSAAKGMGIGKAYVLPEAQERVIPRRTINDDEVAVEHRRFKDACTQIYSQIDANLKTKQQNDLQNVIFETYLLMLTDPVFIQEVNDGVSEQHQNVEAVLEERMKQYADRLRNSGNDYLAERAQDIEDVFGRVMNVLLDFHEFDIDSVPDGSVIVAKSMKTSDTVILSKRKIAGLALTDGGLASHVAILAKS